MGDEPSDIAAAAAEALNSGKDASGSVSKQAHLKILLHSARFPWADVCGALIGTETKGKYTVNDAIPFFHSPMMAPMLEIGMAFVEEYCKSDQTPEGSKILGWYVSPARDNMETVSKPHLQVANKLKTKDGVCLIAVRTKELSDEAKSGLEIMSKKGENWSPSAPWTTELKNTAEFTKLLKDGRQEKLADMDDFFYDSQAADWRNTNLV